MYYKHTTKAPKGIYGYFIAMFIFGLPLMIFIVYQSRVLLDREINYFIKKETNGTVVGFQSNGRGSYSISIRTKKAYYIMPHQQLMDDSGNVRVQMGDSISKAANSRDVAFYRKERGVYKKYWSLRVQTYTD